MPAEPEWTPLTRVFQRARAIHKSGGNRLVEEALKRNRIKIVAEAVELFEANACFEFETNIVELISKSAELASVEEAAFRAEVSTSTTYIHYGERHRLVFWDVHQIEWRRDVRLSLLGATISEVEPNRIVLNKICGNHRDFARESRDLRDIGYERLVATGLWCKAADVETEYPYSIAFPSRQPVGRKVTWPIEKTFEYLEDFMKDAPSDVKPAEIVRAVLKAYSRDFDKEPAKSTVESHVDLFLRQRTPFSRERTFELIKEVQSSSDAVLDDNQLYAGVSKSYKRLGIMPSYSDLRTHIREYKMTLPPDK
jgi:hypothetical protein